MPAPRNKELKRVTHRIYAGNPRDGDEERYKEMTGKDASTLKRMSTTQKEIKKLHDRLRGGSATAVDEANYKELTGRDASTVKRRSRSAASKESDKNAVSRAAQVAKPISKRTVPREKKKAPPGAAQSSKIKKRAMDNTLSDSDDSVTTRDIYHLRVRKKVRYIDPNDSTEEEDDLEDDADSDGGSPEEDAKMPAVKLPGKAREVGDSSPVASVQVKSAGAAKTSRGGTRRKEGGTTSSRLSVNIKQEEGEETDPRADSSLGEHRCAISAVAPDHTDSLSEQDWQHQDETEMEEVNQAPPLGTDGKESHGAAADENTANSRHSPPGGSALVGAIAPQEVALPKASNVSASQQTTITSGKLTIRFYRKDLDEFIDVDALVSPDTFLQNVFKSDGTKRIRKLSKELKKELADKKKEVVLDYINEGKGGHIYRRYFSQELETISTLDFFESIPRNQGNFIDGAFHPIVFHVHFKETVAALVDGSDNEDCYL